MGSTMTAETHGNHAPKVTAGDRSRGRKVLAVATDETRIVSERTAAWLRLTGYAEAAGMPLETFLAVHVLAWRDSKTFEQRMAEAGRLAGIAGEVLGDREVAMLRVGAGIKDALEAAQRAKRQQEWAGVVARSMAKKGP
jgi:hypothetical protein